MRRSLFAHILSGFLLCIFSFVLPSSQLVSAQNSTGELQLTANELAAIGLIDVTNPPAGLTPAKGDGVTDDTAALQAIINYAYYGVDSETNYYNQVTPRANQGRYAVVLPGPNPSANFKGEYLISDSLILFQNAVRSDRKGKRAHILIGSTSTGSRPIIRLMDNAPSFNPNRIANSSWGLSKSVKPVIMISGNAATVDGGSCIEEDRSIGEVDPCDYAKSGDNFEQKIKNIEIYVGSGNETAVGLNFAGAQHSAIEDLKITMESGFAGFDALPGVSSVMTNIEVVGGKYGYYGHFSRDNAYLQQHLVGSLSNVSFINQTDYAIYEPESLGTLTLVGFKIQKNRAPAIKTSGTNGNTTARSELALVDGVIEFAQSSSQPAIDNSTNKGTSLTNVYFKNAQTFVGNAYTSSLTLPNDASLGTYTRVLDYAVQNEAFNDGIVINNSVTAREATDAITQPNQNPNNDAFLTSHTWHHTNYSFDHWYDLSKNPSANKVCNVLDRNTVKGDGSNNDTAGIQAVINDPNCTVVLLPKGLYMLSNTLQLKSHTRLIGLNTSLTQFKTVASWNPTSITPIIQTPNDVNGTATVEDILTYFEIEQPNDWFIGLDWRVGKGSMVKNYYSDPLFSSDASHSNPKPQDRIRGAGGGKWFGYDAIGGGNRNGMVVHPDNRKLLVTNTSQPLNFYNISMEDGQAYRTGGTNSYQAEFNKAHNIAIYGSKNENCNPYGIVNSSNIFMYGLGKQYNSIIVVDSDNIEMKTFSPQHDGCSAPGYSTSFALIQIDSGSTTLQKSGASSLTYYKKGYPDRSKTLIATGNIVPTPTTVPTVTDTPTQTPTPTAVQYLSTDFNKDGVVNILDFALFIGVFQQPVTSNNQRYDLTNDGTINILDFSIFIADFGRSTQ